MRLIRTRSVVEVAVIEGLGNQLFCYAAGLFLAKNSNSRLVLNVSQMDVNPINHGKTILNFNLDSRVKYPSWIGINAYKIKTRIIRKLLRHFPLYRKVHKYLIDHNIYLTMPR